MLFRRIVFLQNTFKHLSHRYASISSSSTTAGLVKISTSDNNQICRILLNNPRQRNILSLAMINDLIKAIEENENRSRIIILTAGNQTVFSSGHSLKELAELSKTNACASVFDRCTELMLKYIKYDYKTNLQLSFSEFVNYQFLLLPKYLVLLPLLAVNLWQVVILLLLVKMLHFQFLVLNMGIVRQYIFPDFLFITKMRFD